MEVPWPRQARYLRTGPLLVDLSYRRVECDGARQELQQRVFDLLLVFLAAPDTLHTRQALFQRLWPGVIVEDANLSQSVWLLRRALGEHGKDWIRTIARRGYVFRPPGPVEWLPAHPDEARQESPPAPSATPLAPAASAAARPSPPASLAPPPAKPGRAHRHWPAWSAAGAVAAAAVALLVALALPRERAAGAAPSGRLAIALLQVEDPAAPDRWPARLLHDWLRWKLGALPELTLLDEAQLAAAPPADGPPRVVLVSAAGVPEDPGTLVVRARVQFPGGERQFEERGPQARAAAMVDALSNRVLAQLLPSRAGPWPTLEADAAAARHYAQGAAASERRDWRAAIQLFEQAVAATPRFGLARLQLARAQGQLSQASAAVAQMEYAQALLQPAPGVVTDALQAQRLAMEPALYREAQAALQRLLQRQPGRRDLLLRRARLLLTAGEPRQARQLLEGDGWTQEPLEVRIGYRLLEADIAATLGDLDAAREHATLAERLARQAGEGWRTERASALMDLARIDAAQSRDADSLRRYARAAELLDAAGDTTRALYARFMAEASTPGDEAAGQRFNALLAKARENGHPRMEIGALQIAARRLRDAGDYARSRHFLEQAWATAQAAADHVASQTLDLMLAGADLSDLRLESAQARLERLERAQPQGARAVLVALYRAGLEAIRGRPAAAIGILDRAEQALGANGRLPAAFSGLNCARASYRLVTGDLARARGDWKLCEAPGTPDQLLLVALGRAQTELMAGDRGAARALLAPLGPQIESLPEGPHRWELMLEHAALLTRAGDGDDAGRLYARLATLLPAGGVAHLRAALETGLAENEAVLGRWSASQAHLQAARSLLPEDAWSYRARLALVEVVAARSAGRGGDALGMLRALHAQAHQRRDVGTMLEVHTLLPDGFEEGECNRAQRERLIAQTGMRGAGAQWLTRPDTAIAGAPTSL